MRLAELDPKVSEHATDVEEDLGTHDVLVVLCEKTWFMLPEIALPRMGTYTGIRQPNKPWFIPSQRVELTKTKCTSVSKPLVKPSKLVVHVDDQIAGPSHLCDDTLTDVNNNSTPKEKTVIHKRYMKSCIKEKTAHMRQENIAKKVPAARSSSTSGASARSGQELPRQLMRLQNIAGRECENVIERCRQCDNTMTTARQYDGDNAIVRWRQCENAIFERPSRCRCFRWKCRTVVKEATEFGYETTKHGVTVYSSQRIACPDWAAGHGPTLAAYDIRPISA
ncbi:hypothetical protein DPMN_056179 [Dreissena polymorpha]|uniref:Uncharacterized protein n=1 Tax=Dreissena polymorpha TaxID=45954 RepID=A0A9D4HUT1_DREPO|nr:hypothetical protein DPMN_056179 [Dreissena polymorpha]